MDVRVGDIANASQPGIQGTEMVRLASQTLVDRTRRERGS